MIHLVDDERNETESPPILDHFSMERREISSELGSRGHIKQSLFISSENYAEPTYDRSQSRNE